MPFSIRSTQDSDTRRPVAAALHSATSFALLAMGILGAGGAAAQFDPNPAWPLCGNLYVADPTASECPSSRFGEPDLINDTYGPRLRSGDYDWHRGIDLHTHSADGRPVYAITCGKTRTVDSSYNGEVIIEHYPDFVCDEDTADPNDEDVLSDFPKCHKVGGCYYSRYKHLSSTVVADETLVNKGQLIGYSGRNVSSTSHPNWSSAYPHVHFEIRAYPGGPDYYARGQREAIHPLQVLPYQDDNADDITVTITDVENGAHQSYGLVEVEVSLPNDTEELDLVRVDVAVYDEYGNEVTSTNPGAGYTTPDGDAYQLDPPFFDMELRSRQYNYTNTTKVPFEKFLPAGVAGNTVDGEWLSPYADPSNATYYMSNFPTSYNNSTADFHLEAKKSGTQEHIGRFNGIEVEPANFNRTYATYDLTLRFERMPLPSPGDSFCYKAWATDARNNTTNPDDATWGSCS